MPKGNWQMSEVAGSDFTLKAELATLAMGFVHPVHDGMLEELGVELDARGNVKGSTEDAGSLQDIHRRGFFRGRYATRAVPGRLGDSRRKAVRKGCGRVSDGDQ